MIRSFLKFFYLSICCFLFFLNSSLAGVKPNSLFTDHMVLQKGAVVPIWGTADEGEKVTVSFNGQTLSTVAKDGKWMVKLKPMPYLTTPSSMMITGKDTVIINDVMVGEVWLCSGQSNMERQLGLRKGQQPIVDYEKERDSADYPLIRQYYVPQKFSTEKIDDANSSWVVCSPETVAEYSAVGYFFVKNLHKKIRVPIGIIFSAYGGTHAEDWTSREALAARPELSGLIKNYDSIMAKEWRPKGALMNGLYNGMINPLLPYAIKGAAWYQGEANAGRPDQYQIILPNMIESWRRDFNCGDFAFLIVQVAPYKNLPPEIREAQLFISQKVRNSALIVTTDCGDSVDIHPPHKQPVGERLALAALAIAYGEKIVYSGPIFKSKKIKKDKIILTFDHVGKGLTTKDSSALKGFTIAAKDKKFVSANAVIKGKQIIVYSELVKKPAAVRYGWSNVPEVNLYNAEGLPASPFRTDSKK